MDYTKYKTPFYQIEVYDAKGKNKTVLPSVLHRLVENIEITESLESCNFTQISITFREGSREPFAPNSSTNTNDIYPSGPLPGDSITNHSGMLPDLKFTGGGSGSVGLTSISASAGAVSAIIGGSEAGDGQAIAEGLNAAGGDQKIDNEAPGASSGPPKYLFHERNQIKVTWGYVEDPQSYRSVRGIIRIIRADFPENSQPTFKVIAHGSAAIFDTIAPTKAKAFGIEIPAGLSETLKPVFEHLDKPTGVVIKEICDKIGIRCIVSDSLDGDFLDAGNQKIWVAGESFHQFMQKLATRHNAHYNVTIDPINGEEVLFFILRSEYNKKLKLDSSLFKYKSPGSILKSVSIRADFSKVTGNVRVSYNRNGDIYSGGTQIGPDKIPIYNKEEVVAAPHETNSTKSAEGINTSIADNNSSGTFVIDPEADKDNLKSKASSRAACSRRHQIILEFTTLGYTKLHPGMIELGNISDRYSGVYYIKSVTHTINSNSYTCKGMGISESLVGGGVSSAKFKKGQKDIPVPVPVGMWEADSSTLSEVTNTDPAALAVGGTGDAVQEYDTLVGLA